MHLGRHDLNYSYTQMGSELIVTFQQKDWGISVDSLMKMSAQSVLQWSNPENKL